MYSLSELLIAASGFNALSAAIQTQQSVAKRFQN